MTEDEKPPKSEELVRDAKQSETTPARKGTLVEFLMASPLRGADIDLERLHEQPREMNFDDPSKDDDTHE